MSVNDYPHKSKPRLPEALHPEIGNGALWIEDLHEFQLRSPDPTRKLESLLFDDTERESIIQKWQSSSETESSEESNPELPEDPSPEILPATETKIIIPSPDRDPVLDWLVTGKELILEEDPNKAQYLEDNQSVTETVKEEEEMPPAEVIEVEGKRVKKAVKKAKKAAKKKVRKAPGPSAERPEESLSPYTSWLKSLRGSEYIHPYEDDFGIEQLSSTTREGISETFADLLAAQGYKDQAIRMYEQLMAKYPEKSSFFAAKIEALK